MSVLRLPPAGILLLLLAFLLIGCAGKALRPGPFPGQDVPQMKHLGKVPFYAQDAYQCGPAALAMMLNSRGLDTRPEALREKVYLPSREGSLQVEMVAAARRYDLLVYPLERELEAIIREVAAGNPVLVLQNLWFDWMPKWHYAVVTGYDLERHELILHSGLERNKRIALRTFLNTWARGEHWARVILPPGQLPATAEPLPFVRAAYDLEQTGHAAAAATAYRAATQAWPDNLAARFARANLALSQGAPAEARDQFARLLERHRDFAPGWYNFALSLQQIACPTAAAQAQACARKLAPDDSRFSQALENPLDQAASATGASTQSQCRIPTCPF